MRRKEFSRLDPLADEHSWPIKVWRHLECFRFVQLFHSLDHLEKLRNSRGNSSNFYSPINYKNVNYFFSRSRAICEPPWKVIEMLKLVVEALGVPFDDCNLHRRVNAKPNHIKAAEISFWFIHQSPNPNKRRRRRCHRKLSTESFHCFHVRRSLGRDLVL